MKAHPTAGIMEVSVEMSPSCSRVLDVRAMNSLSSIVSEQLQRYHRSIIQVNIAALAIQ
jgi:exosome complex RNA-binding protein Rrp42 (RNase PH superfamily)